MEMLLAPAPDFSRCRDVRMPDGSWSPVKAHVKLGVRAIMANPFFGLFDQMGAMKTAQSIIAAQFLYEVGEIDQVLVVAPASVRDVWYDEELGELQKHLFLPSLIQLYHSRQRAWRYQPRLPRVNGQEVVPVEDGMRWLITNYEFIRSEKRLDEILEFVTPKTFLVLDESSAVKSYSAAQTKACAEIRKRCNRVVLLNGTPIANNPVDMFSQGNLMHKSILDCKGITHFRARYAEMGGYVVHNAWGSRPTQIVGWRNLPDLQARFAPYVLRRLTRDCVDLPAVLPEVTMSAALGPTDWKLYKDMRDGMVAWLTETTVSVAPQVITKIMRLSQITSGFIGGLEAEIYEDFDERPDFIPGLPLLTPPRPTLIESSAPLRLLGTAKLDLLLDWMDERFVEDPNLKLLVWCRFVPELSRLLAAVRQRFPKAELGCIAGTPLLGKRKAEERAEALRLLNPQTAPPGPVVVAGTYGTGSLGLNLTASHTVVNVSWDYSYWKFEQSAARVNRPGQVSPISTFDIVAVGPQGQRTIDHTIVQARRDKEEVANWTTSAWVHALMKE